ncbi:MAG: hypothetical protein HKN00_09115 [Flavobacteriaceae bacterium]|nr:hypothetical protein [Bacteroidia bacterium]NNF75330.1 hypothetical protein [Flavobacteriaceae bacterium]
MKNRRKTAKIILWIARVWSLLSLFFMFWMVGAHFIEALSENGGGISFNSSRESISFLFFPVCIMIGLLLAWKWEGLGGLITVLGIVGFHIIRPDLIFDPMIDGLAAPGLIFLLYWLINRNLKTA